MSSKFKIKAIIFDLDGTLLDSLRDIAESMNQALAESGLPEHPVEDYRGFVGNGLTELTSSVSPEDKRGEKEVYALAEKFWYKYDESWFLHTKPYPGILYLVQLCVARKIKVAILSNKVHYFTKKMIRHYFRGVMINHGKNPFGIYSGEQPDMPLKPDPTRALELADRLKVKPENIALLGDCPVDVQTAKNAGMISIGAAWGFCSRKELEEAGADLVFDQPTDLSKYLEKAPIV
ncbi:MAG: HAD family hydrolase [Candidatus Cloacimonetes bacterium]|nr:HAD family hydrolase [Candidatus Cloacimonadota bacterium]HNZ06378.1 HAD family hydrolase [Candidatus Cloacimonadota bacterium]HOH78495.1 HAD family hydrolase [Candidatus Cloacimonadota bacterium]HPN40083.1 HAD family hydrolase [Candidatus Cloacimonadota bacterium]